MKNKKSCQRGTTLLEVIIAFMVLSLAIVGTLSLVLVIETHNSARTEANHAYKACQDVMEQLLTFGWPTMVAQNNITFIVPPVNQQEAIGNITITNINPNNIDDADPANDTTGAVANTMVRITVRVQTTTVGRRPIDVQLVSWRANK